MMVGMDSRCKIVRYSDEYKDTFVYYLKKTFPNYSDAYIDYCIRHAIDKEYDRSAFIILNSSNEIVGCHMYYPTKALIYNNVVETSWGHDTIIDIDYRKEISINFIVQINKVPAFGIGVTNANEKIQKSLRTRFIPGLNTLFKLNIYSLLLGFLAQKRVDIFYPPQCIDVDGFTIRLVENSNQINILNDGFWYKSVCNVDFIRDKVYLDDRFFHNGAYNYSVYTIPEEAIYFVIRPIIFRGIPVLSLVDFRYDINKRFLIKPIIHACVKIAMINHLGGILVVTNDVVIKKVVRKGICLSREISLVANKYLKLKDEIKTNITSADADVDFMRG